MQIKLAITLFILLAPLVQASEAMKAFSSSWVNFNQNFSLKHYVELQNQYELLKQSEVNEGLFSLATQQLAMADTFFGRYERAESRLYAAHPGYGDPENCNLTSFTTFDATQAVLSHTKNYRVVLINESHTRIASRAFVYQLLNDLKQQGFTHLALEALYQNEGKLKDANLQTRGYPLDSFDYGFYLREPVMAEIIRKANQLGFILVAYDAQASSRAERETAQASLLANLLKENKGIKLAVIAGYSHVYKNDDWMAQKLQELIGRPILSINQTSTLTGCLDSKAIKPYVLLQKKGKPWSINPQATDLSVIQSNMVAPHTGRPNWLSLGNERVAVKIDSGYCENKWPCLISARYQQESQNSVPANLLYLENADSSHWLHLKAGTYRLHYESTDGLINQMVLKVANQGNAGFLRPHEHTAGM